MRPTTLDQKTVVETPNQGAWDRYVKAHPEGSFFHLFGWNTVVSKAFGHKPRSFAVGQNTEIHGVLPLVEVKSRLFGHGLISNGFCVAGGPLGDAGRLTKQLTTASVELGHQLGVDYIEYRDFAAGDAGWEQRENLHASFERPIDQDEERRLLQIPRKQRAVVRKSLKAGLTVTVDQDVQTFFSLYALTARNHGTPVFPLRYFKTLCDVFGADCDILTVWQGRTAISSVVSFYYGDRVLPYYTGSRLEARQLGANDLMYWRLMRHAVERGCTVFDFGRSKIGSGPYAFKKNWGFEPRPLVHSFYLVKGDKIPNNSPANSKFKLLVAAWQRLPLPVANGLSQFISRNLA